MKRRQNSRQLIVSRLKAGRTVGEGADLATYPDSGYFVVGLLPEGPMDIRGLTPEQAQELADDGELSEYLLTPEEAADLYLKLKKEYGEALARREDTPSRPATGLPEDTWKPCPGASAQPPAGVRRVELRAGSPGLPAPGPGLLRSTVDCLRPAHALLARTARRRPHRDEVRQDGPGAERLGR